MRTIEQQKGLRWEDLTMEEQETKKEAENFYRLMKLSKVAEDIFNLKQSYGFPEDVSLDLLEEREYINKTERPFIRLLFDGLIKVHQEKSRKSVKNKFA